MTRRRTKWGILSTSIIAGVPALAVDSMSILNPLHALPAVLEVEEDAGLDGEVRPFAFIRTPESDWSDERLAAHVELLRLLLRTGTDPACVVPNARLALELLAERGIAVELELPRPIR